MAENQYAKLSFGKIELEDNLKATRVTSPVYGKIDKIIVKYGEGADPEMKLKITTSDGEVLIDVQTNKSQIYYPRNWNTRGQAYEGINEAGQEASNSERYLSYGRLYIFVEGTFKNDSIEDIQIIIEGKIEEGDEQDLKKEKIEKTINNIVRDTATSTTSGISNVVYDRRTKKIRKYTEKVMNEVMVKENIGS